jgi:hypothetical protein
MILERMGLGMFSMRALGHNRMLMIAFARLIDTYKGFFETVGIAADKSGHIFFPNSAQFSTLYF